MGEAAHLHEVLSADEAFGAQRVDQGAGVLLVLVGPVQGAHDDLTQHLWQEVLGGLHVSHAAYGVGQVLTVQVLGGDPLLRPRDKSVILAQKKSLQLTQEFAYGHLQQFLPGRRRLLVRLLRLLLDGRWVGLQTELRRLKTRGQRHCCCARVESGEWKCGASPVPEEVSGCGGAGRWEASWWGSEAEAWEPGSC